MASKFDRRTLLAGGAAAAAGLTGASAIGWDDIAGAASNGPGRNGVTKATPKRGGSLVFGVDAEEQGFDPTQGRFDEVGVMYARTVFDPLTIVLTNGDWAPYLAESVVPNSSYTAWTITLRPNVKFHDGTACDGAALVTNLEAQSKSLLTGIVINPTLQSITQSGPLAATITFKQPWVPFPYYLAGGIGGQIAYVVAPSMLSNPNGTSHPVGTGPFVFKEWIPNDHFTATANPTYWRSGLPYLSQITFKPIPDESARAEALKSGTIDLMITDTPQIITQFRGNRSYSYIDDSTNVAGEPDMNCVQLNCLAKPFNDPSVRLAAAQAVNRAQYVRVIDEGVLPVSNGLFVPGSQYFSATNYPRYNPSNAKKLVSAAARKNGGPISFTYGSTNSPAALRAAQYLEQAWKAVGFQVSTNIVQQNQTINNALAGKYQALGWRQFGAVDPDLNYIFWSTTTVSSGSLSINMARNADPTVEAALLAGRQGTEASLRQAAYKTVNKRLAVDLPYLWTDRAIWAVIGNPKVQNFNNPTSPQGQHAFGMIGGSIWPTQIWIS
ncbi:MAG TPA: ABC transporter substrate-binding protein [Acidimicrobiales bacterium]|jgi:peptide/nickel transport system substrate-binding protein|nr:ABC transporter substrate-binding protein [Acidimicrobiales bacterium]